MILQRLLTRILPSQTMTREMVRTHKQNNLQPYRQAYVDDNGDLYGV